MVGTTGVDARNNGRKMMGDNWFERPPETEQFSPGVDARSRGRPEQNYGIKVYPRALFIFSS